MGNIRRWYIYGISAIALQALTWAVISLIRNLALSPLRPQPSALAFQIAVIVVGGPLYLAHWLWARRLAARSEEERGASLRGLYLIGMMAGFLGPALYQLYYLLRALFGISGDSMGWSPRQLTAGQGIVYHLIPILVLGLLWVYHRVELRSGRYAEVDDWSTIRRLYQLGFSATGLTMTTLAVISLTRWLLILTKGTSVNYSSGNGLYAILCQLAVGVPVWLIFWLGAGRLGQLSSIADRESTLRKVYLYLAVFIGSIGSVSAATALLAGYIRQLIRYIPPSWRSPDDFRDALAAIIGLGVLWVYHSAVLRQDAREVEDAPQQMTVRQITYYLVAAVGLAALAIGLAGEISVLVHRVADQVFENFQRQAFSWYTAAIVAGLPVFIVPWRKVQGEAREPGPLGIHSRRSTPRRIYLYLFLFLAALVDLVALVFIIYRLLDALLGGDRLVPVELALALGYGAIAAAIWISHLIVLRGDQRLLAADERVEQTALRLAVLDLGDGNFGRAAVAALVDRNPDLVVDLIRVGGPESPEGDPEGELYERLSAADMILGPWTIMQADDGTLGDLVRAVAASPARKLLIPTWQEGWDWVGVDHWSGDRAIRQAVQAVEQAVAGRPISPHRPLGAAAIAWIVVGAMLLLFIGISMMAEFLF